MKGRRQKRILDHVEIDRAVKRIAYEILEKNKGAENLVLMGIPTPGPFLAERIKQHIRNVEKIEIPTGSLDITFYRDDINHRPRPMPKLSSSWRTRVWNPWAGSVHSFGGDPDRSRRF